jgi:hypothetical protein
MTDIYDASHDADGFIIIHTPPPEANLPAYAIGPFPPIEGLAERIMAELRCPCATYSMTIGFPKGIRMMLDARSETDPAAVAAVVNALGALIVVAPDDEDDDEPPLIH